MTMLEVVYQGQKVAVQGTKLGKLLIEGSDSLTPSPPALYRSAIATPDTATLTAGTATAQSGGSLTNAAHNIRVIGVNQYGRTLPVIPGGSPVTPSASGAIRIPITVGSFTNFDIYLGLDTDPKFVGRATAAQVTAGDTLTAAASATANATFSGSGTAGSIEVRVAGAGATANTQVASSAWVIPEVTAIDCTGKEFLDLFFKITTNNRFTNPVFSVVPVFQNSADSNLWYQGDTPFSFNFINGESNLQKIRIPVRGWAAVHCLVSALVGVSSINIYQSLS